MYSLRPSCLRTTRRSAYSTPGVDEPEREGSGSMPGTTDRGPVPILRRPFISTASIARPRGRPVIWQTLRVSCRSTAMPGSRRWPMAAESNWQHAGRMRGGSSTTSIRRQAPRVMEVPGRTWKSKSTRRWASGSAAEEVRNVLDPRAPEATNRHLPGRNRLPAKLSGRRGISLDFSGVDGRLFQPSYPEGIHGIQRHC